jgi:uncharacterized membrane protein YeaQ/YmgE (transglycosylase-associated protein family)
MWIQLIVGLVCGLIAALIANSKGRNVVGWFFGGFFLGLIGIIIVAVLSNLKAEKAQQDHEARERRRLREQLRQERIKNEAFRQHTVSRLDVHDQQLQIDTRQTEPLQQLQSQVHELSMSADPANPIDRIDPTTQALQAMSNQTAQPAAQTVYWHYEQQGQSVGPVSEEDICLLLASGELNGNSLVWTEGMADWARALDISTFRNAVKP